jgi:hypothetical protein
LPSGESGIRFVPPAYLVLVRPPAQINYAAVAIIREINEPRAKVFHMHAHVFDFLDGFAERNQVCQVSRTHPASASAGVSLLACKIDLNAHVQERFSFLEDAIEELAQPGHQPARLAQGKDPGVVGFFVEHIASMLHRVI